MRSDKLNKNSSAYKEGLMAGFLGSYFGLSVGAPSVSSNACTLVINQVNSPTYTGAAINPLTFDCAGTDKWETGCVVPTTSSNKITYDTSAVDETSLVFTPTNDTVNFLSFGSTIEFVCERDGYWYVNVTKLNSDIGVTAGAATGTLLFAS